MFNFESDRLTKYDALLCNFSGTAYIVLLSRASTSDLQSPVFLSIKELMDPRLSCGVSYFILYSQMVMSKLSIGLGLVLGVAGGTAWYNSIITRKYPLPVLSSLPSQMKIHQIMQNYSNSEKEVGKFDACSAKILKSDLAKVDNKALRNTMMFRDFFNSNYLWLEFLMLSTTKTQFKKPEEYTEGAKIGDLFTIEQHTTDSLVVSWKVPEKGIAFGEKLALKGSPFRLMNGGFHELYVEDGGETDDYVTFWFACAHGYNKLGDNKVMPKLGLQFHLLYARLLLDSAVRNIKANYRA